MAEYDSPFFITNDRLDIDQVAIEDGTAVVWPLSDDAKLKRSPERQYCGNYATYGDKGGATYRHNADTHDLIAAGPFQHRDMTSTFPLIRTKPKAQARADRQLLDVQEQDVRITTTLVNIPSTRVTLAKAGMRLQVKGTHWGPTCDDWHYARIVMAQPTPHSDGSLYDIALELALGDAADGPPAPPFTANAFVGAQQSAASPPVPGSALYWERAGDDPPSGWYANPPVATPPLQLIDDGGGKFTSLTTTQDINVRVHGAAFWSGVLNSGGFLRLTLTSSVNGVLDSFDLVGVGFTSGFLTINLPSYDMVAGEILAFSGSETNVAAGAWTNSGINGTFIRIGRGTHNWGGGGGGETWVGP